jgi:ribosomal protein S18 acetylase RimI-like enzyme
LLLKALENAKSPMFTEVLCGNEKALKFYLKQGFEIVKKTKGKLAGNEKFKAEAYYLKKEII